MRPWWITLCFVLKMLAGCDRPPPATSPSAAPGPAAHGFPPAGSPTGEQRSKYPSAELPPAVRDALGKSPEGFVLCRRLGRDVLPFRVRAADAVDAWERLHALRVATGLYPLITDEASDWGVEPEPDGGQAEGPLSEDPDEWFQRRRSWLDSQGEDGTWPVPRGAWIEPDVPNEPVILRDLSGEPRTDLLVMLVPVREGWQVPAFLRIGGWNDCPHDSDHAVVWRAWDARFGAELLVLTRDTVELRAERRPGDREEGIALALQQYVYCYDIVDQGTETVDALAATLLKSDFWFFWWD